MTIIVTADWHLSDNPRDSYRLAFLPWLKDQLIRKQVLDLVILGDLTEEKDRHSAVLTNLVVLNLNELAGVASVTILRGNHDATDPDVPFYGFVDVIPRVRWINSPTKITLDGQKCLFLPWTPNYQRDWANLNFTTPQWIFAHNTFDGARSGTILKGISPAVFPAKANVIAGDIHIPQTFGPITYVGAPYHVDFGDDYEARVLLLDGQNMSSIPVNGLAQKRLVTVRSLDDLNRIKLKKNDIVTVRVDVSRQQHTGWADMVARVREWGQEQGVTVHTVQPNLTDKAAPAEARPQLNQRTDAELLTEYAKRRNIDAATLKSGLELLK